MRRAKIVATLGPATSDYETVESLVRAGLDVARLNLSHGDHATHERNFEYVRRASEATGRQSVAMPSTLPSPSARRSASRASARASRPAPRAAKKTSRSTARQRKAG